jgi:hypothetical protein
MQKQPQPERRPQPSQNQKNSSLRKLKVVVVDCQNKILQHR